MHLSIRKKCNHRVKVPELRSHSKLQWDFDDKINQYKCIETILQQNFHLDRAKCDSEHIKKQQRLNELRQNVKETKLKLNNLKDGEFYAIKNRLRESSKLFNKRRESDRLNYEMNKLTNAYASKLIILTKMQDRHRQKCASESHQLLANRIKNQTVLLDKSEIEIQSYENLMEDLKETIKYLSNESLQYASTLKLLENEINEQNTLLNWLKMMNVTPVKRTKINIEQRTPVMKEQMLAQANKRRQTSTNVGNFEVQIPDRNDQKMVNVKETQSTNGNIDCSANNYPNELMKLQSIVNLIQSKLVTDEEKVNAVRHQLDGVNEKIEKVELRSDPKENDLNRLQSTVELHSTHDSQTKQNTSSGIERISGELFRIRGVMHRFDDLLRNENRTDHN